MKGSIIYYSKTGNTKKVAEAISKAGFKISEKPKDDFLIIGTPVQGGQPAAELMKKIKGLKPKKIAVFVTYGLPVLGNLMKGSVAGKISKETGAKCVSVFACQGSAGKLSKGRPNAEDLKKAREWAEKLKFTSKPFYIK